MRFNDERFEGRRVNEENEDLFNESTRKRKKERREKYKVKNQKVHQINFNLEEDFEDFEGFDF